MKWQAWPLILEETKKAITPFFFLIVFILFYSCILRIFKFLTETDNVLPSLNSISFCLFLIDEFVFYSVIVPVNSQLQLFSIWSGKVNIRKVANNKIKFVFKSNKPINFRCLTEAHHYTRNTRQPKTSGLRSFNKKVITSSLVFFYAPPPWKMIIRRENNARSMSNDCRLYSV